VVTVQPGGRIALAWLALGLAAAACGGPTPDVGGGGGDDSSTSAGMPGTTAPAPDDTGLVDGSSTGEELPPPVSACAEGYAIPGSPQAPGDPEEGYRALLEEGYVTCGIPYSMFALAAPLLGNFATGEPLPGRTGKNADVPYSWTVHTSSSGAEIVSLNCLECHAGYFNGELVMGLGKADADYTESIGGYLADVPIPGIPLPGLEELTRMAQRFQAVDEHIRMPSVGTNPADRLAAVLSAHRDPETLAWIDEPTAPIPDTLLPVDTPPWWHVRKKTALFCNGMAREDQRATMIYATSLCTDSVGEAEAILEYFDDIRAYIASIEAPSYPFAIDETLAAEGKTLFERDCSCCHGTYAAEEAAESYPSLLLPLDVIGTDPILATVAHETPFASFFNGSWYGEIGQLTTGDPFVGYVAPPLDGIWATAPYFHNASVPTLALVLDSTARPAQWRRVDYDTTHFDEVAMGWPWIEVHGFPGSVPEDQQKHVYDTTRQGHWNTGHTFGDHLSDDERRAVIEYLKTL
jgi:mono/diheme cytochrome c family protein